MLSLLPLFLVPALSAACQSGLNFSNRTNEDGEDVLTGECLDGWFLTGINLGSGGTMIRRVTCARFECCAADLNAANFRKRDNPGTTAELFWTGEWSQDGRYAVGAEIDNVSFYCGVGKRLKKKVFCAAVDGDDTIETEWDYECKNCSEGRYYSIENNSCPRCPNGSGSPEGNSDVCCQRGTIFNSVRTACMQCGPGEVSNPRMTACEACSVGEVPNADGTACEPCPVDQVPSGDGTTCTYCARGEVPVEGSCRSCPAGHTTYSHDRQTCVGPELVGYDRSRRRLVSLAVAVPSLGGASIQYWESQDDWYVFKNEEWVQPRGIIKERYTTGYSRHPRKIRRTGMQSAAPIITDVVCYTGKGHDYTGYRSTTDQGEECTDSSESRMVDGQWVYFCRNDGSTTELEEPYCWVGDRRVACGVPRCNGDLTKARERDIDREIREYGGCAYEEGVVSVASDPTGLEYGSAVDAKEVCDRLAMECDGVAEDGSGRWTVVKRDGGSNPRAVQLKTYPSCAPYNGAYFS